MFLSGGKQMRRRTRQMELDRKPPVKGNSCDSIWGRVRRVRPRMPMNTPSILILIILVIALSGCGDQSPSKSPEQAVKPKAQVGQINKDEVALGPQERVAKLIKDAEAGDADAQHKLAIAYRFGKGVPKDDAKAVEWLQKAAEQGNDGAQHNLGVVYDFGQGVPKEVSNNNMNTLKVALA